MQRMKLHMRGIKVPPLGSPRDRVYRDYLIHEQRLEAKRHELALYIALGSKPEGANHRDWTTGTKKSFDAFVSLLWGVEPEEFTKEEQVLVDYYSKMVSKSRVLIRQRADGQVEATGDIIELLKKDASKIAP